MNRAFHLPLWASVVLSVATTCVQARDHDDHRWSRHGDRHGRHERIEIRPPMPIHRHVREVDRTSISLNFWVGGAQFWYREGAWFQPWGAGWRSVMPPVGLVVPVLPTRAVARWHGPRELYWVDGVSYQPLVEGGYQVVAPPLVVARAGQSPLEQESDYQSCNRWAMSLPEAIADARVFHDRVTMCMDSRGYSLR